jgi:hypothetical protein
MPKIEPALASAFPAACGEELKMLNLKKRQNGYKVLFPALRLAHCTLSHSFYL